MDIFHNLRFQSALILSQASSHKLKQWLTYRGSFMQRLKKKGVESAKITVLQNHFISPTQSEKKILRLADRQNALIREVAIKSDDQLWMLARSVFPLATLTGKEKTFLFLKNKTLGSKLFSDPRMSRGAFEFAVIENSSEHYARRSLFCLAEKKIVLTEIFMPDLLSIL